MAYIPTAEPQGFLPQQKDKVDTEVVLEAVPEEGWTFDEWTGDYSRTEEEITVTMDEDKEITAVFEEEIVEYDLTIEIEGEGSIDPEEGTHTYDEGTELIVTATPDEGWHFVEWSGDVPAREEGEEIIVTMDHDSEVEEGEEVTVEYTIENIGGSEGTQDILFYVDGTEIESESITLGVKRSLKQKSWYGKPKKEMLVNGNSKWRAKTIPKK